MSPALTVAVQISSGDSAGFQISFGAPFGYIYSLGACQDSSAHTAADNNSDQLAGGKSADIHSPLAGYCGVGYIRLGITGKHIGRGSCAATVNEAGSQRPAAAVVMGNVNGSDIDRLSVSGLTGALVNLGFINIGLCASQE